jgi:hypothetical protein
MVSLRIRFRAIVCVRFNTSARARSSAGVIPMVLVRLRVKTRSSNRVGSGLESYGLHLH